MRCCSGRRAHCTGLGRGLEISVFKGRKSLTAAETAAATRNTLEPTEELPPSLRGECEGLWRLTSLGGWGRSPRLNPVCEH